MSDEHMNSTFRYMIHDEVIHCHDSRQGPRWKTWISQLLEKKAWKTLPQWKS